VYQEMEFAACSKAGINHALISYPSHPDFPRSIEEGERKTEILKQKVTEAHARKDDVRELKRLNEAYDWMAMKVDKWLKRGDPQALECMRGSCKREQQHVQFNDVGISLVPGEVFTRTGLDIQEKIGNPKCFVAAYANGYAIYQPSREDVAQGGYEVRHSMFDPSAENVMIDHAVRLAANLQPA